MKMKKISMQLKRKIEALKTSNLNQYISDQMTFVEPLSVLDSSQLMMFRFNCHLIEKLFNSIEAELLNFEYSAGNYGTNIYLTFSHKSADIIRKNRWLLYDFFTHIFPVNYRELDWLDDHFIHQSLSNFYEPKSKEFVRLKLALNYDQIDVQFPSHDFFCLCQKELAINEEVLVVA